MLAAVAARLPPSKTSETCNETDLLDIGIVLLPRCGRCGTHGSKPCITRLGTDTSTRLMKARRSGSAEHISHDRVL